MMMDFSHDRVMQAASELPTTVMPILEYAEAIEPDAIIVCDRDARPLGYALEQLIENSEHYARFGDRLSYKRVSKKLSRDAIALHCEPIFAGLRDINRPTIMVVDDHVTKNATTAGLFRAATSVAGLRNPAIHWTTITGKGTALNVKPYASPAHEAPWRDRPEVLGIDYDGIDIIHAPTEQSVAFYAAIADAARQLAA